jgi:isochorismate synthase
MGSLKHAMATDILRRQAEAATLISRMERQLPRALERARSTCAPVLVSVAEQVTVADPSAAVMASRREGEPWFCFEQPDRDRFAVAGLGQVTDLRATGPDRFTTMSAMWRRIATQALCSGPAEIPGSGLIAFGGFAFSPDGCSSMRWSDFHGGSLIVPELTMARDGERTVMTFNAEVAPDDVAADVLARVGTRVRELRELPIPMYDPAPVGDFRVASVMPPSHYEEAVARAVSRIRAGELEKIVLAREVEVEAPQPYEAAPIIGLLREAFPSSFVYAVGRGQSVFLGATPELLIRREGQRASTLALAGSARRSAAPATDTHRGEQLLRSAKNREENAIVVRRIVRTLRRHAVWVTAAEEPVLVRVANIQHLGTPVRAQLASSIGVVELAGRLHPTPAVGAEPAAALGLIPALEGLDRGWYAGPVGWTDTSGDGEFCVALRGALLHGSRACCYAGCGVVADSEPAAELAETEVKLTVMLPTLSG